MIQALNLTNFDAYMNTEANRINVSVASTHIRHLVKFINDFTGDVFYVYPDETINSRFDFQAYAYAAVPDLFAGEVKLAPTGYFKYEVYEVSWIDITAPSGEPESWNLLSLGYAPVTETDVLTVDDHHGVVEGLVAIGKLYLKPSERKVPEVTYRQYVKRVQTIEIIDPGKGYLSPPTITISAPFGETGGVTATATCTLSGTSVNSVTITYAGSGYTETPTVTVSAPPPGQTQCLMIATIEEQNYIYSN